MANLGSKGSRYPRSTFMASLIHVSSLLHRPEALWPMFFECELPMVAIIKTESSGEGLDLALTSALLESQAVPVIACGFSCLAQHFVESYQAGAAAVAAGTFFLQRDQNPMQCRLHIRNAGLPIRLEV